MSGEISFISNNIIFNDAVIIDLVSCDGLSDKFTKLKS